MTRQEWGSGGHEDLRGMPRRRTGVSLHRSGRWWRGTRDRWNGRVPADRTGPSRASQRCSCEHRLPSGSRRSLFLPPNRRAQGQPFVLRCDVKPRNTFEVGRPCQRFGMPQRMDRVVVPGAPVVLHAAPRKLAILRIALVAARAVNQVDDIVNLSITELA